jgi:hypothetical protein
VPTLYSGVSRFVPHDWRCPLARVVRPNRIGAAQPRC